MPSPREDEEEWRQKIKEVSIFLLERQALKKDLLVREKKIRLDPVGSEDFKSRLDLCNICVHPEPD